MRQTDRRHHTYLIGQTGTGKSTLLATLMRQDLVDGRGFALIDPHGDLAEQLLARIPEERGRDVTYLNLPDESCDVGFNPLLCRLPHTRPVAAALLDVFKTLWDESWGPCLEHLLRYALLALVELPGTTLGDVLRIMEDEDFRKTAAQKISNSQVWLEEFERIPPGRGAEAVASVQNKAGAFLAHSHLQRVLGGSNAVDLRGLMDRNGIYDEIAHDLPRVLAETCPGQAVLCGSASKACAMSGWRCGWQIGPAAVIAASAAIQSHSTSNVASIMQKAGVAALTGSQAPVRAMLDESYRPSPHRGLRGVTLHQISVCKCLEIQHFIFFQTVELSKMSPEMAWLLVSSRRSHGNVLRTLVPERIRELIADGQNGNSGLKELRMSQQKIAQLLALIILVPGIASAQLLSIDDPVFGAGSMTRDTASGLEWLDLNITVDRSVNDIASQLGVGGQFQGFRYASSAEVFTLFSHAGIPFIETVRFTVTPYAENVPSVTALIALWGTTGSLNTWPGSSIAQAFLSDGPAANVLYNSFLAYVPQLDAAYASTQGSSAGIDTASSFVGHALVRHYLPVADQIPFKGVEADHQGAAAWNASGSGPEAVKTGHALPWVTCGSVAFYYLASRDFGGIDPASPGGLQGLAGLTGFARFASALAANGFAIGDLNISWGLETLGNDVQGQDWFFDGWVETRFYERGNLTIKLRGEPMVSGPLPRLAVTIDYKNLEDCTDDRIFGYTDPVQPIDMSRDSSPAVRAVAAAFMQDLGDRGIRAVFDSFQPAIQQLEFSGNGRAGAFFEAQSGRLEAVPLPDFDGDGVADSVDGQFAGGVFFDESHFPSNNFTDQHLGGTSFGSIVDRGDLSVRVFEVANPDGLQVTATGGAGTATINACGLSANVLLTAGDAIVLTCSSLITQVVVGPIEIRLGSESMATVPPGATVTVTEIAAGQFRVENSPASTGTVSIQVHGQVVTLVPGNSVSVPPTIQGLIPQVARLNLNAGEKNSLISKLEVAQRSLTRGNRVAATNQLNAFINEIRALKQSRRLDAATADSLIAQSQAVIGQF